MGKGRVMIRGPRVQDVGYRLFLLNLASESNLTGFQARNIGKDCVEALFEGGEEEVKEFIEAVKKLVPREAEVSSIEFKEYEGPVKHVDVFRSEFMAIQLGKIVEIGVEMLGRQDRMLEKQDVTIEKIDNLGTKVDTMGEKVDKVGEKVDNLGMKVDALGEKVDKVGEKVDNLGMKVDALGEKVDKVGEKVDNLGMKVDALGEKVDKVGEKVDAVGAKMDGLRDDLRSILDRRLADLERDMVLVKERLGIHNT